MCPSRNHRGRRNGRLDDDVKKTTAEGALGGEGTELGRPLSRSQAASHTCHPGTAGGNNLEPRISINIGNLARDETDGSWISGWQLSTEIKARSPGRVDGRRAKGKGCAVPCTMMEVRKRAPQTSLRVWRYTGLG